MLRYTLLAKVLCNWHKTWIYWILFFIPSPNLSNLYVCESCMCSVRLAKPNQINFWTKVTQVIHKSYNFPSISQKISSSLTTRLNSRQIYDTWDLQCETRIKSHILKCFREHLETSSAWILIFKSTQISLFVFISGVEFHYAILSYSVCFQQIYEKCKLVNLMEKRFFFFFKFKMIWIFWSIYH